VAGPSEVRVEVVANREVAPAYFSMRLAGPVHLARFRPGQFLMLGWDEGLDPLLPRAMSIRSAKCEVRGARCEVEILYKVFGRGTALLSAMRPGRCLRALGPLGNAFEVPRSVTEALLVAGGIGVPPIAALAEALVSGRAAHKAAMTAFLGGRSKADLLCVADFRRAGAKVHLATEDGSAGHKGLVTDLLEQFLRTSHPAARTAPQAHDTGKPGSSAPHTSHLTPHTVLYACGPHPMLAALAPIAEKYDLPYRASLEANMACGFGACMGCVVPTRGGEGHRTYRLVCKDGPVFDGRDILWI
jgi:dihydroorotate dehydrogenase electron transfer subunit